jgi:uncharacterized protein YjbI with pentapeptide repeats
LKISLLSATHNLFAPCEEWLRSACTREPSYKKHQGKAYCVLHFPGNEKTADFQKALVRKIESSDFDFRGVWFPERGSLRFHFDGVADFEGATFAEAYFGGATFDEKVSFHKATFRGRTSFAGVTFSGEAYFRRATFSGQANFEGATFAEASFGEVTFREVNFAGATFSGQAYFAGAIFNEEANFGEANFGEAYFRKAIFGGQAIFEGASFSGEANFERATFKDYVRFAGSAGRAVFVHTSSLQLDFAKIAQPEHVSFDTLTLMAHWFVNVDAREFDFTHVEWSELSVNEAVNGLKVKQISSPHRLLAIAYRHLAVNAEKNDRYDEASRFRFRAMDSRRRETWHGLTFWRLDWWYWLASGYGERAWQAALVLVGLWLLFACIFWRRPPLPIAATTNLPKAEKLIDGFGAAVIYSLGVMTLQKPEPQPSNKLAKAFVLLETILGPLQAALLALAIRRKFMR